VRIRSLAARIAEVRADLVIIDLLSEQEMTAGYRCFENSASISGFRPCRARLPARCLIRLAPPWDVSLDGFHQFVVVDRFLQRHVDINELAQR
jgi:hypothetical protein